jgi:Flp pilus assembly protein TadG
MTGRTRRWRGRRGQGLVEFSLAVIPFLVIFMGIADLGRGIYMNSGASQAAREIARATAVHRCDTSSCTLGNSPETLAAIATQRRLVPNLIPSSITITCTTITDAAVASTSDSPCNPSNDAPTVFIKVTVSVQYSALTPVLSMVAPKTLTATAHVEVP